MKRAFCSVLSALVLLPSAALAVPAQPSSMPVTCDGQTVPLSGYTIDDSTYFKLRDVAAVLNGTANQFALGYGEDGVSVSVGKPYQPVGGELTGTLEPAETDAPQALSLLVDGKSVSLTACKIGGYNYLKLRDIGQAVGFDVGFDEASRTVQITTQQPKSDAELVWELVNQARAEQGAAPLELDEALCDAAKTRAKEIGEYFSHTRPDGSSCFTVLDEVSVGSYQTAGENIAMGYGSAQAVMQGWLDSPSHRTNIMSKDFSRLGVGHVNGQWVQLFLG